MKLLALIVVLVVFFPVVVFSEEEIQNNNFKQNNIENFPNLKSQNKYLSPIQQVKNGFLPQEIKCNETRELQFNIRNEPICIFDETKQKLIKRGFINEIQSSLMQSTFVNWDQKNEADFIFQPIILEFPFGLKNTEEFMFDTVEVVIGKNNTVIWKNNDEVPHFVEISYLGKGTEPILPGNTDGFTFEKPGTYEYHSEPWIRGLVIVKEN